MNIHHYFSLSDYIDLHQSYIEGLKIQAKENTPPKIILDLSDKPKNKTVKKTVEKKESYQEKINILKEVFISFLIKKGQTDPWKPIAGSEHHQNDLKKSWEKLMKQDPLTQKDKDSIFHYFEKAIRLNILRHKNHPENGFKELIEDINTGNFLFGAMEQCICNDCGCHFLLEVENWNLKFSDYKGNVLNDQQPCFEDKIQTLEVEFKTGHLIALDGIKHKELLNVIDYNKDYEGLSINYPAGRIASTKHFAEKYGFIKVHTTNSGPSIYLKDDLLMVGNETDDWEDEETPPSATSQHIKGRIDCDVWNVTLIEEENLLSLFEKITYSKSEAQNTMDQYLEEEENPLKFNVEPGTYRLSFYHNVEAFAEKHHNEEEEIPEDFIPYFTVKKMPEPKAKFKM